VQKLSPLVFFAVLGAAASGHGADEKSAGPTPDYIKVDMRGKLRISAGAKDEELRARVQVGAVTGLSAKYYELDLPADKTVRELARKLDGETVLITGELVTIYDFVQSGSRPNPPRDVVRVKTLKAAGPNK
jgi:hypothetical protein